MLGEKRKVALRKEKEMNDWTDKRLTKQSGKDKKRQEKGNAH
jgi:hypothetical protein